MIKCTGVNCPMQAGKVDPATCKAAGTCKWATKPLTNADRIRAMTDEELAKMFLSHDDQVYRHCPSDTWAEHCQVKPASECCDCDKCWLDYLKQGVKENA